jgi:integrase
MEVPMPKSGCILEYHGVRGLVYYAKYRDATGRQVKARLGSQADGWDRRRAERALGKLLADVEAGFRKRDRVHFDDFAERIVTEWLPTRGLKTTTRKEYELTLRLHLVPFFGRFKLVDIETQPELIDKYSARKLEEGLAPKTVLNHLGLLSVVFKRARAWKLVDSNPVEIADRPRVKQIELEILTHAEIAALDAAFRAFETEHPDSPWWPLARRVSFFALGTAMRKGEILGLPWKHADREQGEIRVRQTFVAGEFTTPKSKASVRTIELGEQTRAVLEEQWDASPFHGPEDLVFCHPLKGTALRGDSLARDYIRQAYRRAGITKLVRPMHTLRHTRLTYEAAAGNPHAYIQTKAGHSDGRMTERYIHAAQIRFPGAAQRSESHVFGRSEQAGEEESGTK